MFFSASSNLFVVRPRDKHNMLCYAKQFCSEEFMTFFVRDDLLNSVEPCIFMKYQTTPFMADVNEDMVCDLVEDEF